MIVPASDEQRRAGVFICAGDRVHGHQARDQKGEIGPAGFTEVDAAAYGDPENKHEQGRGDQRGEKGLRRYRQEADDLAFHQT